MSNFQNLMNENDELTEYEQRDIKKAIALLFEKTFVLRSENKKEYDCIIKHDDTIIKPILEILGFTIKYMHSENIVWLKNESSNITKEQFGPNEMIVFLIIKDLYITKLKEDASSKNVYINKGDIYDQFDIYNVRTDMRRSLDTCLVKLERYNMIKRQLDDTILIQPSIRVGLDNAEIREGFEKIKQDAINRGKKLNEETGLIEDEYDEGDLDDEG